MKAKALNFTRWILFGSWVAFLIGLYVVTSTGCGKSHHEDHNDHEQCTIPDHAEHPPHPAHDDHPAPDDHPAHDDHPVLPVPVVTVEGLVNHDVSIKHDERSAPDTYRLKVNGVLIADTTFTTTGDGDLVPWVKFSTYQGDIVTFETTGSNQAIVDQTDLEFFVTVQ